MKSDFDYQTLPVSFGHCLNEHCLHADKCLRHQVALRIPKERGLVTIVNPGHVSPDGKDCTFFIDERPLQYARGMTHLLDRVPLSDAKIIDKQIRAYFGRNNYYRSMSKVRLIKPQEQEYIRQLFRRKGITDEPVFDEYVEYYDLSR